MVALMVLSHLLLFIGRYVDDIVVCHMLLIRRLCYPSGRPQMMAIIDDHQDEYRLLQHPVSIEEGGKIKIVTFQKMRVTNNFGTISWQFM
jgi:hypothetical protein